MVQDKDQLLYIEQYFGSIDRFMAYIIEEYKGRFPLWLSPTQVKILPISDEQLEYAKTIEKELLKDKIRVKVDSRAEKIGYKIREAELERVPYMLILGKKEVEEKVLSIRRRGNKENEVMDLENELLTIFISIGSEFAGFVVLEDEISKNAFEIIKKLKEKNIDVYMITGDSEVVARKVATKLGIDNVLYEVMPNEKSQKVLELQKQGKIVAMVGDGINDAPALASADISFAMGTGTDIAMETSDITLMNGNLNTLLNSINISEQTLKIIKQNLFWAFFYNIIAIPFAAFGYLNPMLAGFTMSFSSVSVVLNSLRLKRYKF